MVYEWESSITLFKQILFQCPCGTINLFRRTCKQVSKKGNLSDKSAFF